MTLEEIRATCVAYDELDRLIQAIYKRWRTTTGQGLRYLESWELDFETGCVRIDCRDCHCGDEDLDEVTLPLALLHTPHNEWAPILEEARQRREQEARERRAREEADYQAREEARERETLKRLAAKYPDAL
jgi:hypothetical protein